MLLDVHSFCGTSLERVPCLLVCLYLCCIAIFKLEIDGAGIFAASINYLMRRGDNCPFIIATTHFNGGHIWLLEHFFKTHQDLWKNCYIKLAASVVIAHMRIKMSKSDGENLTLTHLHK